MGGGEGVTEYIIVIKCVFYLNLFQYPEGGGAVLLLFREKG